MPKVVSINPNNYYKVIRHRSTPSSNPEFTLSVFHPKTVLSELADLPNLAFRLFDESVDEPPVFVRLDIHESSWCDKSRYTELRHLIADLLIRQDINIGTTEYPNGLLEYITAESPSVNLDLATGTIRYNRGFYQWTFQPLSHFEQMGSASNKLRKLFTAQSLTVHIANKPYVLVDDTSSAWSSFLATSYPKWFRNEHEYLKALGRAFKQDVKDTALEGVSFTS